MSLSSDEYCTSTMSDSSAEDGRTDYVNLESPHNPQIMSLSFIETDSSSENETFMSSKNSSCFMWMSPEKTSAHDVQEALNLSRNIPPWGIIKALNKEEYLSNFDLIPIHLATRRRSK